MFDEKNIKPMLLKERKNVVVGDYIYELKFDGIRAIVYVSCDELVIKSRNGILLTDKYPELKCLQEMVGKKQVIFDGELVILEKGRPSFKEVMKRNLVKNNFKAIKLSWILPVTFVAFDILYENKPLIDRELMERKRILNKYSDNNFFVKSQVYLNGKELYKLVKERGLEGIVAKIKSSKYEIGRRSDAWLKIKNIRQEYFYVHGYILNKDKYSLLLGEWRGKDLWYVGKVSVGKKNVILGKLMIRKQEKNLFVNYDGEGIYIEPKEKILVSYLERTDDNILRQPTVK